MQINIKATNIELTAPIKAHVNEKFSSLDKYFNNIQLIDIEIGKTRKNQQKGDIFFCEANVSVPRKLLRFRKEFSDLIKAINEAKKGIQNEITKYKDKL